MRPPARCSRLRFTFHLTSLFTFNIKSTQWFFFHLTKGGKYFQWFDFESVWTLLFVVEMRRFASCQLGADLSDLCRHPAACSVWWPTPVTDHRSAGHQIKRQVTTKQTVSWEHIAIFMHFTGVFLFSAFLTSPDRYFAVLVQQHQYSNSK